jgi:hypothetical protein
MSERGTVRAKIGRSATTNQLDERIDQYQSIGQTPQPGTSKPGDAEKRSGRKPFGANPGVKSVILRALQD